MTVPESRDYTHKRCNSDTEVSGPEFEALSDPLANMKRTWCAACEDHFTLDEFVWSDTGERITDYYARHGKNASDLDRFLCSTSGLLLIAAIGLILGVIAGAASGLVVRWLMATIIAVALGLVGAVVGVVVREMVISPLILKRVCGVADSRCLK